MTPQLWQSILKRHPEANFLQSPEWSNVNKLVGNKPTLISKTAKGDWRQTSPFPPACRAYCHY